MLKSTLKYLGSLRCTIWLLVALIAVFSIGFFLPQRSVVGKAAYLKWQASAPLLARIDQTLQLTDIFTAPVTLVIWGLFFLNLLLVMKQRIPLVLAKVQVDPEKALQRHGLGPFSYSVQLAEGDRERIPAALAAQGYQVHGDADRFFAIKNRRSPLATLVFHLSFFLLLIGWLISFYSRFTGFVDVSEHEPFLGELARYNAAPKLPKSGGGAPEVKFLVESVRPEVSQGVATGIKIVLKDEAGATHQVDINEPYKTGYASVLFNDLGISPLFVLQDASGREIDGAYVKLDVLKGKRDHFRMQAYDVAAWYYPDHVVTDGKDATRSEEFKNPAFHLEVTRDGKAVASGTVHPGEAVLLDNGLRLGFKEQNFWVRLLVTKEYGREFIYAGFMLALVALIWRLVYYRREITGVVRETAGGKVLELGARGDFYQALAKDEFDRTVAALTRRS
ncbi:cytochrome c biogenesis protein ResB [Geomonas azotofigens]|uniref:cytochrome c biogenesis protein ResB n=1 Tax=Geomonas azotofigens TaxID=2843196 RepID=UPI001C122622|nr:cytochrome c biogenesis protein ResB [Geomonas azotofigens]MBU5615420.1 cytochrome c biogenesis protein ResB [Geomonas azotofigens]